MENEFKTINSKKQYKRLKISRWIALFVKIISLPLLQLAFIRLTKPTIKLPYIEGQTLGQFLALFLALTIYYAIIFIINRKINFKQKTDLKKCIAVYVLVVLVLFTFETLYANPLKNYFYSLTKLGLKDGYTVASFASVKNIWAYMGISLGVFLGISLITKKVTFWLFKYVLSNQERLDRI